MSKADTESEGKWTPLQEDILRETAKDPWASQQTVADRVGDVSRGYVTETVLEDEETRGLRDVARHGIDLATGDGAHSLLSLLLSQGHISEAHYDHLREALESGIMAHVAVRFERA